MRRDPFVLLGTAFVILASVATANVAIEYRDPAASSLVRKAVVLSVDDGDTMKIPEADWLAFKQDILRKRRDDLDGLLVGSSTLLGTPAEGLFGDGRWLNMALNSNFLYASLGQSGEYLTISRRITHLVISLDWALGMPFSDHPYTSYAAETIPSILEVMRDALSLSMTERSAAVLAARVGDLLPGSSSVSTVACQSGDRAVSLDGSGACQGLRTDGSFGFLDPAAQGHYVPISPEAARALIDETASGQGIYYRNFTEHEGIIPDSIYDKLGDVAAMLGQRGGKLTLVMPPMLPGLARALEQNAVAGPMLASFKARLRRWAAVHGVEIVDLSESERFGCEATDFGDGHHALKSCWAKIDGARRGRGVAALDGTTDPSP